MSAITIIRHNRNFNLKRVAVRWLLLLLMGVVWAAHPEHALAHAAFDRSEPAPNSVMATSPDVILIWFTEPLEYEYSQAVLYDQNGEPVAGLSSESGPDAYSLRLPIETPLATGTWSVAWNTLSKADGHTQQGFFAFTVGTEADVTSVAAPVQEDDGPPLWLKSASRWSVLLAIAPMIAGWLIWLVVLFPVSRENDTLRNVLAIRVKRTLAIAFVAAIAGNLLALTVQAATLSGGSLVTRIGDTLTDTRYGELWALRIALLAALAIALRVVDWHRPSRRRLATAGALALSLLLPLPISLNAHASALDVGRTTAIVFDWVHIVAAGVWFGGLILLAGGLLPAVSSTVAHGRKRLLGQVLPRFSATALVCWGLLTATGAYAAWLQVGSIDALRSTDYGKSLSIKLALVAVILLVAAFNLLVVTRRLTAPADATITSRWKRRLSIAVSAEIVLTVLVLFMVGRMTSLEPARDAVAASDGGSMSVALTLDEQPATLQLTPGVAGQNHIQLTVPGDPLPEDTEAVIQLELQDGDLGLNELDLDRASGNLFEAHSSEFGIAGTWDIEVIVRLIGEFSWEGTAQLEIPATAQAGASEPPWRFTSHSIAGLLLLFVGFAGLVIAWQAGHSRLRTESGSLAVLAIVLGLGIMVTDRVTPTTAGIHDSMINPVPATADSIARGEEIYAINCLSCHGAEGRGDGLAGAALVPPPADFTASHTLAHSDAEWFTWIRDGKPDTNMPAFDETLTDEQIWDVINYVQTEFQGQSPDGGSPVASPVSGDGMEDMDHE